MKAFNSQVMLINDSINSEESLINDGKRKVTADLKSIIDLALAFQHDGDGVKSVNPPTIVITVMATIGKRLAHSSLPIGLMG